MSTDDRNNTPRDDEAPFDDNLRALYRQLPAEEPHPDTDAAIRAAARKAVMAGPQSLAPRPVRTTRWAVPLAAAASLVIAVTVVLKTEHPERAGVPQAVQTSPAMEMPQELQEGAAAMDSATVTDAQVADAQVETYAKAVAPAPSVKSGASGDVAVAPAARVAAKPVQLDSEAFSGARVAEQAVSAQATAAPVLAAGSGGGQAAMQPPLAADDRAPSPMVPSAPALVTAAPARLTASASSAARVSAKAESDDSVTRESVMRAEKTIAQRAVTVQKMAVAEEQEMVALELPFTVALNTQIQTGVLAGFLLQVRTGSEQEGAASFRLRAEASDAEAWRETVIARLRAAGWEVASPCAEESGVALQSSGQRVVLEAGDGGLDVRWRAAETCPD